MTLAVRGLVVSDGRRKVVSGVDLDIAPGKITAVIGANGAGKSELVLALAGVLPVAAGSITLDGAPLPRSPEAIRRAGIAAIPEGHRVLTDLSVEDTCGWPDPCCPTACPSP
jgi:branched-chain amino acid transport system ATP-binding protein